MRTGHQKKIARRKAKLHVNIRKIKIEPDDVLVLTFPERLTAQTVKIITEKMREIYPHNKALILDGGTKLQVVTQHQLI